MKRTYLEEDIRLINQYFPGAKRSVLHTPFDLTESPDRTIVLADDFRGDTATSWYGDLLWNQ